MTPSTLRAASESRYLDGLRVHAVDARLALTALVGVPLAVALVAPAYAPAPFALVVGALSLVAAGIVVVSRRWTAGTRLVNDGQVALQEGRLDAALALLRTAASRWHFKHVVAVALHNLGVVATRRGDFADAVLLLRAAYEMLRGARVLSHPQTYGDLSRANLVFALACEGQLPAAETLLREPSDPNAYPLAAAMMARARALVALRRNEWKSALEVLATERRLLRNVVVGHDAPLLEAFEAFALARLDDDEAHRRPVLVDDDDRAYIVRILPDAAPLLALR